MTIERTRGKARPTMPRSSDLKPVGAVAERPESRDSQGRFAAGNAGGRGRGWKRAIARMLGHDLSNLENVATAVAEDAWRLFSVSIREMPQDGPNVRALIARKARHEALEGYWTAKALAALGTPEGDTAEAKATQHGVRAERLTVTALDVARALAAVRPKETSVPSFVVENMAKIRAERERLAAEPAEDERDESETRVSDLAPPVEADPDERDPEAQFCGGCGSDWVVNLALCTTCGRGRPPAREGMN
jgi:hypothetical protein